MSRILITERFPTPPKKIGQGIAVVVSHPQIGMRLGLPAHTLQDFAKAFLKKAGYDIASPITASRALRRAVNRVIPGADAATFYREMIGAILRSGIDTERLISVGSQRARIVALIAREYKKLLDERGLIDSDAILSTAVHLGLVEPTKVLIYGYFRARQLPARPEEIEFIDRFAGDGSIFCLPCGDEPLFAANREWVKFLESRGWQIALNEQESESINSEISDLAQTFTCGVDEAKPFSHRSFEAFEYQNIETEIRGTLARAKAAAFEGVPLNEIAIVCRDLELYAPLFISTAREYHLPLEISLNTSIGNTGFGEFVSLLFETINPHADGTNSSMPEQSFAYESTLRLMLHRFGPGLLKDERAEVYRSRPSGFDRWYLISNALESLKISDEPSSTGWISWLRETLDKWNARSCEEFGSSAIDMAAYNSFFESLDDLAAERGNQIISAAEFSRDVVDVLAHVKIPMHAERGGIRILLPNDIVGLQFERVFVIGMAEGILPAPSVDSSVIDFWERKRLRELGIYLEDALEVPRWEALTFYFTLLACKDRIVFSYPKFAGDSERLPSAFFKRLGVTPAQSGDKYISSVPEYRRGYLLDENEETNDDVLIAARHQYQVESRRESDLPPDEYDGVIGIPVKRKTWSASSLSRIGSCAFKWFAHDILKLNEIKEGETDLRTDTRGRLMHKTLELAVKRVGQTVDLRSAILEILEEEFTKAEAEESEIGVVSNWHLRRSEQIEKLRVAVASEHFVRNGATIVSTERRFKADFCDLTITGVVDRIDRLPDGKIVAVDYKSGTYIAKVKDDDGYLKIDLQLPIYSRIAAPKLFPDAECAGGQFFHLSTPKVTRGKETDLETFLTRVKSLLAQGNFAVDPDRKRDACKYCEYDIVCRTGPRLMRKCER